jgi:hypothetical protein
LHLLYCDESNLEERSGDFFVYGGLVIASDSALAFTQSIEAIRRRARIPDDFVLKFNPRPDHLSHQDFLELKQVVIESVVAHGCVFLTSMILHDIATNPVDARRNAINTICYHFDCYLHRPDSHGLVLIDRFDDSRIDAHLREKFSVGLRGMPYSQQMRLSRIVGFHYSAIGQAHMTSAVDIVLGSFRYAINAFTRNDAEKLPSARRLLQLLAPLFFREGAEGKVSEISIIFSPKIIRSDRHRSSYERLKGFLAENGIDTAQPITNQRLY